MVLTTSFFYKFKRNSNVLKLNNLLSMKKGGTTMPDLNDTIGGILQNADPGSLLISCICICLVLYAYRNQLYEIFETYVMGKLFKKNKVNVSELEKENKKEPKDRGEDILTAITELRNEVAAIKKQQEIMSVNQDKFQKDMDSIMSELSESKEKMNQIFDYQEFLMMADKEDKKAYITREYNYYFIRLKKIDLYSKETLEKIYEIYLKENGDTFVAGMMSSIRSLPVVPQITTEDLMGINVPMIQE